jgi:capsular exopolysaccharide synthesis family protein
MQDSAADADPRRPVGRAEYLAHLDRLAADGPWSRGIETLLGSLVTATAERPFRSLLVTSAAPGAGKTTIAANLGLALARTGQRVLIVDADLRRPRFHRFFGCEIGPGLVDLLSGREEIAACTRRIELPGRTGASLAVIPSGSAAGSASLAQVERGRLAKVLEAFVVQHDVVVLDAPPVLAVSDALLFAPHADAVLLVVAAGDRGREAQRAVERIESAGGRIAGVALNAVDDSEGDGAYHPYASRYGAGGS